MIFLVNVKMLSNFPITYLILTWSILIFLTSFVYFAIKPIQHIINRISLYSFNNNAVDIASTGIILSDLLFRI